MSLRAILLPIVICVLTLFSTQSSAQSVEGRQPAANSQGAEPSVTRPPNANSIEAVVNEIDLLRKSLQTLNARLREISERLPAADAKPAESKGVGSGS